MTGYTDRTPFWGLPETTVGAGQGWGSIGEQPGVILNVLAASALVCVLVAFVPTFEQPIDNPQINLVSVGLWAYRNLIPLEPYGFFIPFEKSDGCKHIGIPG